MNILGLISQLIGIKTLRLTISSSPCYFATSVSRAIVGWGVDMFTLNDDDIDGYGCTSYG